MSNGRQKTQRRNNYIFDLYKTSGETLKQIYNDRHKYDLIENVVIKEKACVIIHSSFPCQV